LIESRRFDEGKNRTSMGEEIRNAGEKTTHSNQMESEKLKKMRSEGRGRERGEKAGREGGECQ